MKDNAFYHVTKIIVDRTKKRNAKGVLNEQFISIGYKDNNGEPQRLKLRKTDDGNTSVFITNNFKLSANWLDP